MMLPVDLCDPPHAVIACQAGAGQQNEDGTITDAGLTIRFRAGEELMHTWP